ncbi:MAG: polyphosphate:AMP phosphotransferase [Gemmatimonadetes bacterium]|nr:polyphosphate:AMP phosphotransferase [Gemmatimonadota bacterium]
MFEQAEKGLTLSDRAYETTVRYLRSKLLSAHFALRDTKRQVVVIVSGADGAGKGELVHRLNEWLDPRGVVTHAFWDASDEEEERPHFWRFWRAMPGKGRVGIFFGSWYTRPIIERVKKVRRKREFMPELDRIVAFERMLTEGGTTFVKLWMHLAKDAQREKLAQLDKDGRIGPDDWEHFKVYDRYREVSERALVHTNEPWAPWHVVDATDRRHREVEAGKLLLAAIETATAFTTEAPRTPRTAKRGGKAAAKRSETVAARAVGLPAVPARWVAGPSLLDAVDLTQKLSVVMYEREMKTLQERLSRLAWAAREQGVATVLAFEGWDAAGKGSAIRRVTGAIDPRLYRVTGIAAPTDEERAQHYLWRFWRHIPRDGRIAIFDRSWYGRVLVERVEGFAPVAEWDRAFGEINAFERQLTDHGMAVAKFWIHISADEQLKRFKERERVVYKRFKITDEDWRNRKRMPAYREAVEEMLARCTAPDATWTVVAGNDKRFARVQILRAIADRLERALG